ncbi:MAG: ferritin [Anaerolineaceae bacterium 4572_32.2]|nr:MAG: ferritin [Anaerolineaceae bacterium 4572_32.2]
MGTKGRKIVGKQVDKLVEMLNQALADEWLAYYQYWVGAKVVKGPMREAAAAELLQHATEELGHAELLANRLIQLGGTPLLTPQDWYEMTNCGYESPADPYVEVVLKQNIKGEQCAIGVYQKLVDFTREIDPVTYEIVLSILTDEIEHEEDLEAIVEDIQLMKERR